MDLDGKEVIIRFVKTITENVESMPEEISDYIDEHFFELFDNDNKNN